MKAYKQLTKTTTVILFGLSCNQLYGDDLWKIKTIINYAGGDYQYSQSRDDHSHISGIATLIYAERAYFTLGYQLEDIGYQNALSLEQEKTIGQSGVRLFSDRLGGSIELGVSYYKINSKDSSSLSSAIGDNVKVIAPSIAFSPWNKSYTLKLESAQSDYHYEQLPQNDMTVKQWAVTGGVSFNQHYDWIQAKLYQTDPDHDNYEKERAVELLWKHWFGDRRWLGLDNFYISALFGDRQFSVDTDSHVIGNLSDLETSGYELGGGWHLSDNTQFKLGLRLSNFKNQLSGDNYSDQLLYVSLEKEW